MLKPMKLHADELRARMEPLFNENFEKFGELGAGISIWQNGKKLRLTNESGVNADGYIDGRYHLTATWSGTKIGGTVSHRGRQIDWDNGTYWTR